MGDICTDAGCDEMLGVFEESVECDLANVDRLFHDWRRGFGDRLVRVYLEGELDTKGSLIRLDKKIREVPNNNNGERAGQGNGMKMSR